MATNCTCGDSTHCGIQEKKTTARYLTGDPEAPEQKTPPMCDMCGDELGIYDDSSTWIGLIRHPIYHYKRGDKVTVCGDCYDALIQLGVAERDFIQE